MHDLVSFEDFALPRPRPWITEEALAQREELVRPLWTRWSRRVYREERELGVDLGGES